MQNLNSSNAKSRKLFYYLKSIPLVFFLPGILFRFSLKQILKNNNSKTINWCNYQSTSDK